MRKTARVLLVTPILMALGLSIIPVHSKEIRAESQDKKDLLKKAKITKEAAQATALRKVPDGVVQEAELEQEDGKLVWSFDLAWKGKIKEVQVDAKTGKVVKVQIESKEQEANEKAAEATKATEAKE